jgi:large subunit ribosomal protein L18
MKAEKRLQRQRTRRRNSSVRRIRERSDRPRLCVRRSSKHIYAQVIEPETGRTLCGAGSTAGSLAGELAGKSKTERAAIVGREIARRASEAGIKQAVFDRGGHQYHGRVKALADAAREGGLEL